MKTIIVLYPITYRLPYIELFLNSWHIGFLEMVYHF